MILYFTPNFPYSMNSQTSILPLKSSVIFLILFFFFFFTTVGLREGASGSPQQSSSSRGSGVRAAGLRQQPPKQVRRSLCIFLSKNNKKLKVIILKNKINIKMMIIITHRYKQEIEHLRRLHRGKEAGPAHSSLQ